jgi:small GTP-binding protein
VVQTECVMIRFMPKPIVAFVGRPNVGKSTLFNRLAGEPLAIVDETPGTTRDRLFASSEWNGMEFDIIDTGGIDPTSAKAGKEPLSVGSADFINEIRTQAEIAIQEADAVLFLVDGIAGATPADLEVAGLLRKRQKKVNGVPLPPIFLVVNKVDESARIDQLADFYSLGMGEPFAISAAHGTGTGDLLDALVASVTLEGINFYSAFAYFYNLARNQKMLKTSTMISYINRDELVHTRLITDIINQIIEENPHLFAYVEEFAPRFFDKVVRKEIEWSHYILKDEEDIDMIEMEEYIKYRANKCLSMMRIKPLYEEIDENPMPWIRAYMEENTNLGKTDFFENRPRTYTKVSDDNGFDEL